MIVIASNQSTAALRRIPFTLVDATDFVTPEDISVTGVKVSLNIAGGTPANSTNDIVKVAGSTGEYYLELTQTEANQTAGTYIRGTLTPSGCALTKIQCQIGPSGVFGSTVDANVVQISGDSTAADNAESFFDGTGYAGGTAKLTVNTVQVNGTAQTAGDLAALITTADTVVDAIKAKTDNLPSDPADASVVAGLIAAVDAKIDVIDDFLDTEVAAIKAKTDSLTFTQAGHVDANIQRVNDVLVAGDGAGTPWGP